MQRITIEGLSNIAQAVGRSKTTTHRWIRLHGFPASKGPNGQYMTTVGLIERWILARQPGTANTEQTDGTNHG